MLFIEFPCALSPSLLNGIPNKFAMRLTTYIISYSLLTTLIITSCDKTVDFSPGQCNCDIESLHVSAPSIVTYQVSAYDNASVTSITYQTPKGQIKIEPDSIPFTTSVHLEKGDRVSLIATGNPKGGSIVLGYEVQEQNAALPMSSSTSRVWVLKDGSCQ